MNTNEISKVNKFALVIATLSLVLGGISSANAANKTLTCYKGTVVKKVTAKTPKCPAGYTTKFTSGWQVLYSHDSRCSKKLTD